MMTRNADKKREQMMMFSMDDMVPKDHMLRLIDKAINWNFIYDLVEDKYCADNGRPSMDPVTLIKIPFIQYLYGIKSMRQTIKEIEVNVAYRWFLGLDMLDPAPHFSTFGKNYTRRFKDTGLFEQIFARILEECMKFHLVDTAAVFVDSTHVKACANSKKMRKRIAAKEALWYGEELKKEIAEDRKKHVFAYAVETACDRHGWILGYTVHPGNEHDSRSFYELYQKVKTCQPKMIVADAGYKTPAIARLLLKTGIEPLFPYKRPIGTVIGNTKATDPCAKDARIYPNARKAGIM